MATYQELRDRALNQVGCLGQSEAQTVAQIAMEEAMKFVAFHIRVPSLIAKATATAPASPNLEANAISLEGGAGTFQIPPGVYQAPDRLFVKRTSTTEDYGTPHEYIEYHHFLDLKAIVTGPRVSLYAPALGDERPDFSWTITPDNKVWCSPISEGNVITLFYRKNPAAYSGAATPEILPRFDYILVNAAVLALKEWLREPEALTTLWTLFQNGISDDVKQYDSELQGQRRRSHLRIHRSYRV